MERTQIFELMNTLKLYGMRSAYDEVMGNGIKRQINRPGSSAICCSKKSPRGRHAPSDAANYLKRLDFIILGELG